MPAPAANARDLLFVLCVFAVLAFDARRHRVYIRVVLTGNALEASHRTCAPMSQHNIMMSDNIESEVGMHSRIAIKSRLGSGFCVGSAALANYPGATCLRVCARPALVARGTRSIVVVGAPRHALLAHRHPRGAEAPWTAITDVHNM